MKTTLLGKLLIAAGALAMIVCGYIVAQKQYAAALERAKPRMTTTPLYPVAFLTRQNGMWLAVLPKPGATEGDMIPERPQDFRILSRLQPYTTRLRDGSWLITFQPPTP